MLENFRTNWKVGVVVAIVNIPLSISLGIASGATPLQGLLTAIRAGLIAALVASNRHNIFGPAGALSGILLAFTLLWGPATLPFVAVASGLMMLIVYFTKTTIVKILNNSEIKSE